MLCYREAKKRANRSLWGALDMLRMYAFLCGLYANSDSRRRHLQRCEYLVARSIEEKYYWRIK